MSIPAQVYLLALGTSALATALTLPLWRRWSRRVGLVDDPGHRKIHHIPIPLAGGLAVLTGMLLPLLGSMLLLRWHASEAEVGGEPGSLIPRLLAPDTVDGLLYGFGRRRLELSAIVGGALAMVLLGWLDDRHELRPAPKFAGQCLIAGLVAAAGVRITLFVPSVLFSYAVTILWILTVTNAMNFLDNMNGLCGGVGCICAGAFGLLAALQGQYLVALLACLTTGALLGFLPFNFPRATAFLGDSGSHLVGFLLAVVAILPHFYTSTHPARWAVLTPLLVLGVPLGDLAWVVVLRWRSGRPVYVGDTNHLSHRLVKRGLSQTGAVLVIWLLTAACAGLAWAL